MIQFKAIAFVATIAAIGVAGTAAPSRAADYRAFGVRNRNEPIAGVWMARAGGTEISKPTASNDVIAQGGQRDFALGGSERDNDFAWILPCPETLAQCRGRTSP